MQSQKNEWGAFNIEDASTKDSKPAVRLMHPKTNTSIILAIDQEDPDREWIVSLPRLNTFVRDCGLHFTDGPVRCYAELSKVGKLLHDHISAKFKKEEVTEGAAV